MGMQVLLTALTALPGKSQANNAQAPWPSDQLGAAYVSELQAKYSSLAYLGKIFAAANPTGITATAIVSGTTTVFLGFCLTNPVGSQVNLHVLDVGYACYVPPATAAPIVVVKGYNAGTSVTQTTPLTVYNSNSALGAGTGLAASSVTVPTAPNTHAILGVLGTGAVTTTIETQVDWLYDGKNMLVPGSYMLIGALVASGAAGAFASATWAEQPL